MRLYVIRHGESETNLSKKWTGWLDVHLTDKGKEDARKAGEFLKTVSFDKVYTSDLCRAVETAEIAVSGCDYEISPLLREINVGTLANKPLSSLTDAQRAGIGRCGYTEFDGETKEQMRARICRAMKEFEALNCETVAVFTHAGWMRGMLDVVVGTNLPRDRVCCNNCAVAVFEYANGVWRLHSWINLS